MGRCSHGAKGEEILLGPDLGSSRSHSGMEYVRRPILKGSAAAQNPSHSAAVSRA